MAEVSLHGQRSAVLARRLLRTQLAVPWQPLPRSSRLPAHLTQLLFHLPSIMTPEGGVCVLSPSGWEQVPPLTGQKVTCSL